MGNLPRDGLTNRSWNVNTFWLVRTVDALALLLNGCCTLLLIGGRVSCFVTGCALLLCDSVIDSVVLCRALLLAGRGALLLVRGIDLGLAFLLCRGGVDGVALLIVFRLAGLFQVCVKNCLTLLTVLR